MQRLRRRWVVLTALLVGWVFGWTYAWQAYLIEALFREPEMGIGVFTERGRDVRVLWGVAGAALSVGGLGVFLFALSSIFREHSIAWCRAWLAAGTVITLVGLSLLVLFPSATSVVIDEHARVLAVEQRWLYTSVAKMVRFEEMARINLRAHRTRVAGICQRGVGLSIIRSDGSWVDIPFGQEDVARHLAKATGIAIEDSGLERC